ncbi:MAG: aminotransferase class III-fold pyridoxal phosphate-dependent enzyme [Alphaproteobacteria bacterium]|nr:aminotransferase class III-fold pyridoxal phosphate-dependent enzyme [Alphaproteobacteria bacterium]
MILAAFIQARMSSTRLPGKVLRPLGGEPVLARVVRQARAIPGIDRVAVVTSEEASDDPIAAWCAEAGVACRRGALADVLDRFRAAAEAEGLSAGDGVMRLTADCPVLDPMVCGLVARLFRAGGVDYAHNVGPRSWPDGLDCEVFSVRALRAAADEASAPGDREHVGPYIKRNRRRFPQANLTCPIGNHAAHRWTLDRAEDLAFLERLIAAAGGRTDFLSLLSALDADAALRARSLDAARCAAAPIVGDAQAPVAEAPASSVGYAASNAFLERARAAVPLGSQTFSKSHIQYPAGRAPMFLTHGDGARVWDLDGNEYVDLVNGLLPVVLGYCDPDVDEAVRRQLDCGVSFSMATTLEAELAERLVRLIPCAEQVRFGKNGSDATTGAVRLARAMTGRERVALCGYHGWHDWYIGSTSRNKGVPEAIRALSSTFPYNDAGALEALLEAHPNDFAAVVMEIANATPPAPGFLETVRRLTEKHGVVLIFDEIITGFRFALGGAQQMVGVVPDLACFGKSMGNGLPISAVVGRESLMRGMEEIFFSGTFGGEALSLAAAIATIDKLEREDGIARLWRTGEAIANRVAARTERHGLSDVLSFAGYDPWRILAIQDHPHARKEAIRTRLLIELLDRGVLVGGGHNISCAMGGEEVERIVAAYDAALGVLADELSRPGLEQRLPCPAIEPVFKVR